VDNGDDDEAIVTNSHPSQSLADDGPTATAPIPTARTTIAAAAAAEDDDDDNNEADAAVSDERDESATELVMHTTLHSFSFFLFSECIYVIYVIFAYRILAVVITA